MSVITVSREYGSLGEEIAQQLANRLSYSYFGKDILAEVARAANTTEEQIRQYDEKDEHGLRAFLRKLFLSQPIPAVDFPHYYPPGLPLEWPVSPSEREKATEGKPQLNADEVLSLFRYVIEKLWKRGNVVIVGRGSQKILAAKPGTLHVRFVGSVGDRSKQVMSQENLTYAEALKKIESIDRLRAHYLKYHYDADWGEAKLYHLVINTSLMPTEQVVQLLITAVQQMEKVER